MNELKPVACRMKRLGETIFVDNEQDAILFAEQGWTAESVYIIPATHRVVSVELLRTARKVAAWPEHPAMKQIQAIIGESADGK